MHIFFFEPTVGFVFSQWEHTKEAGFFKIPIFCYFLLSAEQNKTVQRRLEAILPVKQFYT